MGTIDFKTKFDELFGEESAHESAPTLQDVAPGLVDTGNAKFVSKELNPRRTSVSARHFRSPRVRSAEGISVAQAPTQTPAPAPLPETQSGFEVASPEFEHPLAVAMGDGGGANPGFGSSSFKIGGDTSPAGGELGTTVGNEMAAQLGTMGGLGMIGAIPTAMAAHSLGATSGQLATGMIGTGVMSALSPAILANTIGGGLVAGQMGIGAVKGLTEEGVSGAERYSPEELEAQRVAGFNAASSKGGLIGMGMNYVAGKLGMGLTPAQAADKAAWNEALDQSMTFFDSPAGSGAAGGSAQAAAGSDSGLVGPIGYSNTQISEAFGVDESGQGLGGTGMGNIGSVAGAAGKGGNITGLFDQGPQAEQGAPVGIGGTTGQPATGRGGFGGISGSVGMGNQGAVGMGAPTGETGEGFGAGGGGK